MKLGFIGTGNMAGAIMGGVIKSNVFKPEEIIGADLFAPGREKVKELYGINVTDSNKEVIEKSEVVIFSVKPQFYADVIQEVKDLVRPEQLIITIAPGKTLAWLAEQFGKDVKIVRTMPNTPAMVGEGMTAATPNEHVTKEELDYACKILSAFGKVEVVTEHMMDAVVAVSGSSPAYLCLLKQWQMLLLQRECREHRHTNLQHRQFLEVRRWSLKQESIRENSKTWYAHRQEQRLKP